MIQIHDVSVQFGETLAWQAVGLARLFIFLSMITLLIL